jgi:hypothetical protein
MLVSLATSLTILEAQTGVFPNPSIPDPGTEGLLLQYIATIGEHADKLQCNNGNLGLQSSLLKDWSVPIRFNTDNRGGGCGWSMAVLDSAGRFPGLSLSIKWGPAIAQNAGETPTNDNECVWSGNFQITPTRYRPVQWATNAAANTGEIGVDTDDRKNKCPITFTVDNGPPNFEWRIRIWNASPPDAADKIICGDSSIAPPGYRTATLGKPVQFVFDMRHGWACIMQMQLAYAESKQQDASGDYTVVAGDTLWKLAKVYLGDSRRYMEIFRANAGVLLTPNMITVGQHLKMPGK